MKSNGDASAAGGGGAQGSIAGGAQSLELPPPPKPTEQRLRPKQLVVVVVCFGWSQCCSVIGPGAEWGRSLSSLTPCTALRLSAEEVGGVVPHGFWDGGHVEVRAWTSGPSASGLRGRRSKHLASALVQPRPAEAWKRPPPPAPTRLLADAGAAVRNQRYCIHYLRLKAGPRQAPPADAYSKCGSLLSAAQSSEAATARVLDEAHLEKIKSIVSLSSP